MSYLVAQIEERLEERVSMPSQAEAIFSMKCSIQTLKRGDRPGILSQICYRPSRRAGERGTNSVSGVFFNAKKLNSLLTTSEVFVVKDLDGDHGYYLRMDTILLEESFLLGDLSTSGSRRSQISQLLDHVTQDVDILLKYFHHRLP